VTDEGAPKLSQTRPAAILHEGREHLLIPPNSLVCYVDDSGDERLGDRKHPLFAFGGVACVSELHASIAARWKSMKAEVFPQVTGPLHAKTHLREGRLSESRRAAVIDATAPGQLGRFGVLVTNETAVRIEQIVQVACLSLVKRLNQTAVGIKQLGLWKPTPTNQIILIFEESSRLGAGIERYLSGAHCDIDGLSIPLAGCFMPKSVANPFLEMADFVVNTIARNVKYQQSNDRQDCTPNFKALFRDVARPLASYIEITSVLSSRAQ
jgi:Protein of unknown function (DUF3800)